MANIRNPPVRNKVTLTAVDMPKCVLYQSKQIPHVKWNGEKLLLNINTVKHLLRNAVAYILRGAIQSYLL